MQKTTIVSLYTLRNRIKVFLWPYYDIFRGLTNRSVLLVAKSLSRLPLTTSLVQKESISPPRFLCRSAKHWMEMYGRKLGASYISVEPACVAPHALPKTPYPTIRQQLTMDLDYEWPATFVVTIPNGRVWEAGYIITPDGQLLDDVSCDFRARRESLFAKTSSVVRFWKWRNIVDYRGSVAVLSTDGAGIYYHWFFQLLPRFELLRRAGIDLQSIDFFLVNDLSKSFQRDSIKALGIDPARIIESSKVPYLRASQLVVPSIPIGGGCYRPWMCQFLRATFLGKDAGGSAGACRRRLYISRGQTSYRRVLNEGEVIRFLHEYGFEVVSLDRLSMWQQAASMASCEAVIAPHGAGLSNIVFCNHGTKVIEIFSPELVTGIFWRLASQCQLDYYYIIGAGSPETKEEVYQQSWSPRADITVDLSILRDALELAGLAQDKSVGMVRSSPMASG
jgi:capsular polysaccharide biosynthesis protein